MKALLVYLFWSNRSPTLRVRACLPGWAVLVFPGPEASGDLSAGNLKERSKCLKSPLILVNEP